MGYKQEMSWVGSSKRWTRMLDGKRYWVSPRQLGAPPTKEASREAANAYWYTVEQEHYASKGNPAHWAHVAVEASLRLLAPDSPLEVLKYLPLLQVPKEVQRLIGMSLVGQNVFEQINGQPATYLPPTDAVVVEDTAAIQVQNFIKSQELKVKNGKIKPGSFGEYQRHINTFLTWFSADKSVKDIDCKTVTQYHGHISGLDKSGSSKKAIWTAFKMFVSWLDRAELITLPRNLKSKDFAFEVDHECADYWTKEDFQAEYSKADDFGRLILLLAANTGMYGSDMAQVKYKGGSKLMRGRVKTGKKSPTVEYALWPETQKALSDNGHLLKGCYSKQLVEGKLKKVDKVGQYAARFIKNIRFLRHTSNQALEDGGYRHYKNTFLCNKSRDLSDKVYSDRKLPQEVSDYLRTWYGF